MSIKVGDVDVAAEIVELHFQLHRTQRILDLLISKTPVIGGAITLQEIENVDRETLNWLKEKFPNMGITKK